TLSFIRRSSRSQDRDFSGWIRHDSFLWRGRANHERDRTVNRLEAVIFDWAGTTVDFGSIAPVEAITEAFATRGIQLSDSDVRRDMGLFKKDHIRRILQLPHVEAEWQQRNSRKANESDIEVLFCDFTTTQMRALEKHSKLIRGVANMAASLRERG